MTRAGRTGGNEAIARLLVATRRALLVRTFALITGIPGIAALAACSESAALRAEQVTGSWEKMDDKLPPIHLLLWVERDTLRARLRLSGTESIGTAALDGTRLRLNLSGRDEPLGGKLLSGSELQLGLGGRSYLLRKRD